MISKLLCLWLHYKGVFFINPSKASPAGMPGSGKLATLCHTNIEIFMEVRGLEDANSGGHFVNYYPGALP